MGYNPQESLKNTINTMGTLLGVHPIVPWIYHKNQLNVARYTSPMDPMGTHHEQRVGMYESVFNEWHPIDF